MNGSPNRRKSAAQALRFAYISRRANVLLLAAALAVLARSPAAGFVGEPPPPGCAKTVSLVVAVPEVTVGHGRPTTVRASTFVFVDAPGCTEGDINLEIAVDVHGGPGVRETTIVTHVVEAGLSEILIDVSVPPHAGRACRFEAEARATFIDGSVVSAQDNGSLCLVSLAGTGPADPPLNLSITTASDPSGTVRVHPGDAETYIVTLTNNTEREFNGVLAIESNNVARRPTLTVGDLETPKIGVYSLANPSRNGDFPIALREDGNSVCLHLPGKPSLSRRPTLFRQISIAPAASIDIEGVVRSWGLSSTGTLGKISVTAEGSLDDGTREAVCANAIVAVDQSVLPRLKCTDGGVRTFLTIEEDSDQIGLSLALPDLTVREALSVPAKIAGLSLVTDLGDPVGLETSVRTLLVDDERGRFLVTLAPTPEIAAASRFTLGYKLRLIAPEAPSPLRLLGATILASESTPTAIATVQFNDGAGIGFSVDLLLQLSLKAHGADGAFPLSVESFGVVPDPDGLTELSFRLVAARQAEDEGLSVASLTLAHDIVGFTRIGRGPGCAEISLTDVFTQHRSEGTQVAWRITPPGCMFERIEIRDQSRVVVVLPGNTTRAIVPCRHVSPFAGARLCVVGIGQDGTEFRQCVTTQCSTRPCPAFQTACNFEFTELLMSWGELPEGCCERIEVRDFLDASSVLTVVTPGDLSIGLSCYDLIAATGRSKWAVCIVCVGSDGTETKKCCEYVCPWSLQRPFDCTQDGSSNVSDAVCVLGHFFVANPPVLPCNEVGKRRLFDFNGDTRVDLSDAVAALRALFANGPPHPLGRTDKCVEVEGCPHVCPR